MTMPLLSKGPYNPIYLSVISRTFHLETFREWFIRFPLPSTFVLITATVLHRKKEKSTRVSFEDVFTLDMWMLYNRGNDCRFLHFNFAISWKLPNGKNWVTGRLSRHFTQNRKIKVARNFHVLRYLKRISVPVLNAVWQSLSQVHCKTKSHSFVVHVLQYEHSAMPFTLLFPKNIR